MIIKHPVLASLLGMLGHQVKSELVVDDSNGLAITFPEITDIAEIAAGIAVDAPDGTYVVANGTDTITMVVLAGLVESVDVAVEAIAEVAEINEEVQAVLEAVVEAHTALKLKFEALEKDHKALKVSLKHAEEPAGGQQPKTNSQSFKVI